MLTPRLFRTSTFQFALFYLALFSLTLLTVLGVVYWSVSGLVERQMAETVAAELRGLSEQYRDEGLQRLIEVIRERSGPGGDVQNVYLLTDARLRPLAGNLGKWPEYRAREDGWLEMELARQDDPGGEPHLIRARRFDLPGDFRLLVGRDTEVRADLLQLILEALAWALAPALGLGLLGGVLIGRYSLRRVDAVGGIGKEIVKGDLSRRVPVSGSGDEFDRLAVTINEMLEQIQTLMTGMRVVTDSLAHDLRSPLTRIKSGIEQALRRGDDPELYRQTLEATAVELETILRTFEALINIAEAEAGMDRQKPDLLDLSSLVDDLYEVYQPLAEEAGIALDCAVEGGIEVLGRRQLLAQAIANLLDNAVKYTPAGGQIRVQLLREIGQVRLSVTDNGPGIPEADRERVLQRFVRLDTSRGTPGSGLGLSLVAAVAKLHDGRLTLADNDPGLRVSWELPAAA